MWVKHDPRTPHSLRIFLLGSLISTIIAIVLVLAVFHLNPIIAIGLAAAWIIAGVLLAIGYGLEKLGEAMGEPEAGNREDSLTGLGCHVDYGIVPPGVITYQGPLWRDEPTMGKQKRSALSNQPNL